MAEFAGPVRLVQPGACGFGEFARDSVIRYRVIRPGLDRTPAVFAQHCEVVSGVGVPALGRACQRVFGLAKHVRAGEEHGELECAVGIAALVGTMICGGSAGDVTALFEQRAKLGGGCWVAALVSARERVFGLAEPVRAGEEHPKLESALRETALVGALICRGSADDIAALFEQQAQVVSSGGMAALVRAREGFLGLVEPVLVGEQHRELERPAGIATLVGAPVGGRRTGDLAPLFEQHPEFGRARSVSALVCPRERLLGLAKPFLRG